MVTRRQLRALLERPRTLVLFTLAVAYGGGAWMVALHHVSGGHERNEPALLMHVLRDSTLALPAILAAAWLGLFVATRLLTRYEVVSRPLAVLVTGALVGGSAAVALGAGNPVHSLLFEAHEQQELSPLIHVGRDTLVALLVSFPLALGVAAWALRAVSPRRSFATRPRTIVALGVLAAAVVGAVGIQNAAAVDPGTPCPAGAPLKTFDVRAINVDITLNRFGDHDPLGKMYVLADRVADVRAQETRPLPGRVSTGLRDDPIQPLVIRANQGDCVEIAFTNNASGGPFGIHIDGLEFAVGSSGDAVGANPSSAVGAGGSATYRYYVPDDETLEGGHYLYPGAGNREAVAHGLFGQLVVEPPGSVYKHPETGAALQSGWEAVIDPGTDKSFREHVIIYHEFGNEEFDVIRGPLAPQDAGMPFPTVDGTTDSYRPASRALNYRSEPFMNRLEGFPAQGHGKSQGYGSYMFGDPATPNPRSYLGEPTKMRVVHAGSEIFHVHHLHGGGDRWRFNPKADPTWDYGDTGLDKHPKTSHSPSARLDSQSTGPGESYNTEIEGGAGGVQQAAGDFLFHCHIATHYVSGMWSFWRVFDTRQPGLLPLADQSAPPDPVDSAGLIGRTMPDGTVITAANLDDWIRPQLPTQGVPQSDGDASVWNWTVDASGPAPVYLGEPEATGSWPDLPHLVPGHPGSLPSDVLVGNRPKMMFNPDNGRPAFPLLRPHPGKRPPFSPNGHSGAPWLGEQGEAASSGGVDPYAGREDGLCPTGSPLRRYNVVALQLPIRVVRGDGFNDTDPFGKIFALAKDKSAILGGSKPAEPLAIRGNIEDCIAVTLTSEQRVDAEAAFPKVNMHIHHVQFDPQASDGVISGLSYEQSVRPYRLEDPTLRTATAAGATTLELSNVAKFQPGVWVGVGLGTEGIEIRQIASIDAAARTVTLTRPLSDAHPAGQWAGVEYVQYRWYPDVALDNIFWHDHVDGIHGWGHGLVGQLLIEPKGSTYHDPRTGAEVDSGTIVDIRTSNPLASGLVEGSYREFVVWPINDNPVAGSTFNVRAEPWQARLTANADPSLLFSSYTHGDPFTPLPRAYPGDPFVIRTIAAGPTMDALRVTGHRFFLENRYLDGAGRPEASPLDTLQYGISERFTLILDGGAGGPQRVPGDYLYMNARGEAFRAGAWGILRVLPGLAGDLQPLPGTSPPAGAPLPSQTGGRPPEPSGPGDPCPAGAPTRSFDVSAVDVPAATGGDVTKAYVVTPEASAVQSGARFPEPLALHVAAGECVTVVFRNQLDQRASFHAGELLRKIESSGANVGFNPEQTVAPGASRTYRYYADTEKIGAAVVADFGGNPPGVNPEGKPLPVDAGVDGLYGAVVVAPAGASFTDPLTGLPRDVGTQIDVHVPGTVGYRDFTLLFSEQDPIIGTNVMPYKADVLGPALVNYRSAPRPVDTGAAFSGNPVTPILRAYRGDPVRVHALLAPSSEQVQSFGLGGLSFPVDPFMALSQTLQTRSLPPWGSVDAHIVGGAGGGARTVGDFLYGMTRRPYLKAGMWGLMRVLSDPACPIRPLPGRTCLGGLAPPAPTFDRSVPASPANHNSPSILGTAPAGTTVRLYTNSTCTSAVAASGSAAAFASPGLVPTVADNSSTTFFAAAVDADGGTSLCSSSSLTYREDSAAPGAPSIPDLLPGSDSGASQTDNITKVTGPIFAGRSTEPGVTVKLFVDGIEKGSAQAAASAPGDWRITTSGLAPGTHAVTATATDQAGNTGPATAPLSITIDTTAPRLTAGLLLDRTAFSPNGDGLADTLAASGTFTEPVSWTVEALTPDLATVFSTTTGSGTAVSASWDGRANGGAVVADGSYRMRVRGADAAGNGMKPPIARAVTVDTVAPAITAFVVRPDPSNPTPSAPVEISATVSEASTVYARITKAGALVKVLPQVKLSSPGTATFRWDGTNTAGSAVVAGTYRVVVTASDAARNSTVQFVQFTVVR